MSDNYNNSRKENAILSKRVAAGRRTYFFDVKTTKGGDYYISITESKKRTLDDGSAVYEKHKIFFYREDYDKLMEALTECFGKMKELRGDTPDIPRAERTYHNSNNHTNNATNTASTVSNDNQDNDESSGSFSDVNFEDLK
jgi:hypothetical protein